MNEELTKRLNEKYPDIFLFQNLCSSNMFHFECGDGWYNILDGLFDVITREIKHNNSRFNSFQEAQDMIDNGHRTGVPKHILNQIEAIENGNGEFPQEMTYPVAQQIKEKFGTLSVYLDQYDPIIGALTSYASTMSARTCEKCGNVGESRKGGWIRTLCDPCNEIRLKELADREARWADAKYSEDK